jgi:hypothetical protein
VLRRHRDLYDCAYRIIARESGWNPLAVNKHSGACGLPQALPCAKLAQGGGYWALQPVPDWQTNPNAQVDWFIAYCDVAYGGIWEAAQFKFGWMPDSGIWIPGHGWY